jgi:MYXO-CTERM domain-containing protein
VLLAPASRANGRFPNAQQVRELGPRSLVVAGTYGLFLTTNATADFAYVCETQMFGHAAGSFVMDPLLEVAPDGALVTGSLQAARVSRDGGCGFETIASLPRNHEFFGEARPVDAENGRVIDLCRRGAGEGAPLVALVSIVDAAGIPLEHRLYEAREGTDFVPLGAPIPAALVGFASTLDVAPSDPDRVYVSGRLETAALLARSRDGGASWELVPIPVADPDGVLGAYLGAVSRSDPERIYVRASRRRLTDAGYYVWDDSLLVSDDAGDTFAEPLRKSAALLGFALANDGETVLAGYGDPRADPATSVREELGIYAAAPAPAPALTFERIVSDVDVSCLHASPSGLYACATEADPLGTAGLEHDFHLGLFTGPGLPASRTDFTPLLRLRDVRGPAPWGALPSPCESEWRGACGALFACDNDANELTSGALRCGDGAGGEAGGFPGAEPSGKADSGCGCRSPGGPRQSGFAVVFAFLLVWWHRTRSKCRPSNF